MEHSDSKSKIGAHMGPEDMLLFKKSLIVMKNNKIVNKNIKGVISEKLKVKTWFCDKDLSSVNVLSKPHDFTKSYKFV